MRFADVGATIDNIERIISSNQSIRICPIEPQHDKHAVRSGRAARGVERARGSAVGHFERETRRHLGRPQRDNSGARNPEIESLILPPALERGLVADADRKRAVSARRRGSIGRHTHKQRTDKHRASGRSKRRSTQRPPNPTIVRAADLRANHGCTLCVRCRRRFDQ